jgi:hypothetical protein
MLNENGWAAILWLLYPIMFFMPLTLAGLILHKISKILRKRAGKRWES